MRGYLYDKVTGIVKCPDEIVGSEFNVTELNKNFTKVDRPMLNTYKENPSNYDKFTTSCTTGVTNMTKMFYNKQSFNHSISTWDTSSVVDMSYMFFEAKNFNQDISKLDTSSVEDMYQMFTWAEKFNSDISKWDTSKVTSMDYMFFNASNFNQSLTNWCVNISVPTDFSLHSPIENNAAFQPLWNGA